MDSFHVTAWLTCHFGCHDMLGGIFSFNHHPAKFGPCENEDITFFICHVTTWSKCRLNLWVDSLILTLHRAEFVGHGPCESRDVFLFFTWPSDQIVVWPCSWDFLILSYHPATLRVRRPCENWDITFFICHVTTWLCWCGFFILSHQPATFIARALWKWR